MTELRYFAWMRERIGKAHEEYQGASETLNDLIDELCERDAGYAAAFENMDVVCAAIDQELVTLDAPINNAKEIAFFPPMTGG